MEAHMTSNPALSVSATPASAATTISKAAAQFLEHCRVAKHLSPNTLRAYASDLAQFGGVLGGGVSVDSVDRDAIRRYAGALLDEKSLNASTVKRRIATLKVLFRWLEREGVVPLSVFHRLDLSIRLPTRLPRALEAEEMRCLLRTARRRHCRTRRASAEELLAHFIVVTLFTTGLRVGELISIQLDHVSLRDGTIQVRGKGNRERRVYLAGRQALILFERFMAVRRRILTLSDRLFVTAQGMPLTTQYVRKSLRQLGERAGLVRRVTPHMLRHTAATQLLEAGVDTRFVQRLLGHASIATTQIYTQVRDTALQTTLARANTLARLIGTGR
jgi:site-specific recombinase XerD